LLCLPVWFSSYYPTPPCTGRSVPPSRPHHASGPLTLTPRPRPMRLPRSRAQITPRARLPLGGPYHGAHDPSHGHDHTRHGCGHVPSSARPAHALHDARTAHAALPPGPWLLTRHANSTPTRCCYVPRIYDLLRSTQASRTIRPARPEPATRQGDHPPPYISPGFVAYWPSRGSYSGFVAYWPFRLSLLGTGPRSRGTLSKDTIREVGGS
jgi:hypothetical protein